MKDLYNAQGFVVVKNFIPLEFANYLREYFNTLKLTGRLKDGDTQAPNSHCVYGDPAFDTFMLMSTPLVSNITGIKLLPTYTYARIYEKGSELLPHIDRNECQHSLTLSLGGEYDSPWPIWMMKKDENTNPSSASLNPGDIVVYKGTEMVHWREKFQGITQYQVFIHYVEKDGPYENQLFDTRPYIGLPSSTKKQ